MSSTSGSTPHDGERMDIRRKENSSDSLSTAQIAHTQPYLTLHGYDWNAGKSEPEQKRAHAHVSRVNKIQISWLHYRQTFSID
jgi:hypothetical protein